VSEDYLREQARKKQQPVLRGITTQADLETAPPLTTQQEALIKRVYYDQKLLIGRDGLWHYMAGKYKNAPSQKQVGDWLRKQELAQIYQLPRKSGTVNSFIPSSKGPWHATSMDLVDFVGKPAGIRLYKYILVYIDNFSRYMICRPITNKSPDKVGPALQSIIEEVQKTFGKTPSYVLCDDGSEWLAKTLEVLKQFGIDKRKTLGGTPQGNGMAERHLGILKRILAKIQRVHKQNWAEALPAAVKSKNNMLVGTMEATPNEALKFTPEQQKAFRDKIIDRINKKRNKFRPSIPLEVGTRVRLKLAKGVLSAQSSQSFSSTIWTIEKVVISKNPQVAAHYLIKDRSPEERYSRADVLPVVGEPEHWPEYKRQNTRNEATANRIAEGQFTRSVVARAAEAQERRETRQQAQRTGTESLAISSAPKRKPPKPKKAALKVGEKVKVRYPDKDYPAQVDFMYSDGRVRVLFKDGTNTILAKSQRSLIIRR